MQDTKPDPDNNLGRGAPYDRSERMQQLAEDQGTIDLTNEADRPRIDHHWLDDAEGRLGNVQRVILPASRFKELIALARRSLGPRRTGPEEEKRESTF